jgi:hypothetical protein
MASQMVTVENAILVAYLGTFFYSVTQRSFVEGDDSEADGTIGFHGTFDGISGLEMSIPPLCWHNSPFPAKAIHEYNRNYGRISRKCPYNLSVSVFDKSGKALHTELSCENILSRIKTHLFDWNEELWYESVIGGTEAMCGDEGMSEEERDDALTFLREKSDTSFTELLQQFAELIFEEFIGLDWHALPLILGPTLWGGR